MKRTYKDNTIKEAKNIINYMQKKISKTLSYSINNELISRRDTKTHIPSHIKTNEDSSCISSISTPPLSLPTIKPNKVDEFFKKIKLTQLNKTGDSSHFLNKLYHDLTKPINN